MALKLDITERFYKGDLVNEKDAVKIIKSARNINIVGKISINLLIKEKVIRKEDVIKIKNIPHAIIFEL